MGFWLMVLADVQGSSQSKAEGEAKRDNVAAQHRNGKRVLLVCAHKKGFVLVVRTVPVPIAEDPRRNTVRSSTPKEVRGDSSSWAPLSLVEAGPVSGNHDVDVEGVFTEDLFEGAIA